MAILHRVVVLVLLLLIAPTLRSQSTFELDEATIPQLQDWMASGRYTSRRLVDLYLQRIAELDGKGPTLRSVIVTNPDGSQRMERFDETNDLIRGALDLQRELLETGWRQPQ